MVIKAKRMATLAAALMACGASVALAQNAPANTATPNAPATAPAATPAAPAAPATASAAPAKPKAVAQSAVTPVEQIRMGDRSVPLNIRTLAEVKRLQEEKDLREKLQTALKGGTGAAATTVPVAAVAGSPEQAVARPVMAARPAGLGSAASAKRFVPTLVGVFGPSDNMQAEVQSAPRRTVTVKAGDTLGRSTIEKISPSGLTLRTADGRQATIGLGEEAPL